VVVQGTSWARTARDRPGPLPTAAAPARWPRRRERARDCACAPHGGVRGGGSGGRDLNGRFGLGPSASRSGTPTTAPGAVEEEVSIEDASRRAWGFALAEGGSPASCSRPGSGGPRARPQRGRILGDRETSHGATSGAWRSWRAALRTTLDRPGEPGVPRPTLSDRYYRGERPSRPATGPRARAQRAVRLALRRPGRPRRPLYRYEIRDLVERYREGTDFFFRNRGRALLRGIELEAQAEIGGGFSAELGAQAAAGRALDDDTPLADIPAEGLTLTLRKAWGARGGAWVRATLRATMTPFLRASWTGDPVARTPGAVGARPPSTTRTTRRPTSWQSWLRAGARHSPCPRRSDARIVHEAVGPSE
jgi:hypothetical protein